jgi:molybdenum cofactor biosynthesis protein A
VASLMDSYGRRIASVRISLTDRCNFRCVYCTPAGGFAVAPSSEYLTKDEVVRLVRLLGARGVTRVRLTGGEPLLRRDIVEVVRAVRAVSELDDLSMTTNASRLDRFAQPLRDAGLDRVNVSLDSLDPVRFNQVVRAEQYERVRAGIDASLRAGFPTKVNVVVLRGISDDEIFGFVRMATDHDIEVRFLEFMPLCGDGWEASRVYPIGEIRDIVRRRHDLAELPRGDKTAQVFAIAGGRGRVGFIGSLSEPFCESCSRIRISADGKIRPCLFSDYEVELKGLMRSGAGDEELMDTVVTAVSNKPAGNQFIADPFTDTAADRRTVDLGPFIRSVGG